MNNRKFVWLLGMAVLVMGLVGCPDGNNTKTITITFVAGEGSGTPPASKTVTVSLDGGSETVVLPDQGDMIAPEGLSFQGWKENSRTYIYQAGGSFTLDALNSDSNYTFTAVWALYGQDDIVITFDVGEGSGTAPESIIFKRGQDITFTLPDQGEMIAPEGTSFYGWYSEDYSAEYKKAGETVTRQNYIAYQSYTAVWRDDCTITYSMGDGGGTPPASETVPYGTTINLPTPTAPEGKVFDYWWSTESLPYPNGNSLKSQFEAGEAANIYKNYTFEARWTTKKYSREGIYVSLISFAGDATILNYNSNANFIFLDYDGKNQLSSSLSSRYNKSSESGTALFYGAHKALANLTANAGEFPSDISSVNMITFTDGLDNSSFGASNGNPIEDKSGITSGNYAAYVHDEIANRKINEKAITAYSVGVMGEDVEDKTQFSTNLGNLASSEDNVKELADMSELEKVFTDIAEGLTFATHFAMTTTQNDPGTIVRMTFDVTGTGSADAVASSKYIEGTLEYANGIYTLTNVSYNGGITSDIISGGTVTGTSSGNNVIFLFRNISGYDNVDANLQQWTKPSAGSTTWQRNSEYSASGATSTSTVLIQMVLDASTSLSDTQIGQIRSAVNNFITTLYDRVNN